MGTRNNTERAISEILANTKSKIFITSVISISQEKSPNKPQKKIYTATIDSFSDFCRQVGTLFNPEIQIQTTLITKANELEHKIRTIILNEHSYQDTGHDILHLFLKIFNSAIETKKEEKIGMGGYHLFSEDCLALTFYRNKELSPEETRAIAGLVKRLKKEFRRKEAQIRLITETSKPDFTEINNLLIPQKSKETIKRKSDYLHTYSPFHYELYSLEFGKNPDKVIINDILYYVDLPICLFPPIIKMIRDFTGEILRLKPLSNSYSKNTIYQALSAQQATIQEEAIQNRNLWLDFYDIRSIRFSKTKPSIITHKVSTFYVSFPDWLMFQIEAFTKKSLGPKISMCETSRTHENHRIHVLSFEQEQEIEKHINRQHSNIGAYKS